MVSAYYRRDAERANRGIANARVENVAGGHIPAFENALASFYEGCQRISEAHRAKMYPNIPVATWELQRLQKRARIKREGAAHCFVDYATGDVLLPASWSAPAKHARGNIFDAANGLGSMGPYGPATFR
jgi:hypothetical protein